jgi:plastocyanin
MKKAYVTILAAAFVGIATATAFIIMSSRSDGADKQAIMCAAAGKTRTLTIQGGAFSPEVITVDRCDRIRVVNKDNAARLIALGEHDNHIDYPGFKEKSLGSGDSFTFTAHVTGRYHMHDHVHDNVEADITIR